MIVCMIIVILAFVWLGLETRWFTVQLLTGKFNPVITDNWTPYYKELLESFKDNRPRSAARTIAEWDKYNKEHATEIELEQAEYARKQAERARHTCNICKKHDDLLVTETKTIVAGNSTCHVTGCPDCIAKYTKDIENAQIIRQPVIKNVKPVQPPLFITRERVGSHREYHETSPKHGYHTTVEDFETVYHSCLVPKEWLKEHEHFEMSEPTIDITIDDKTLPVNGNYKKGLIAGFMQDYTQKIRVGKKSVTILKVEV